MIEGFSGDRGAAVQALNSGKLAGVRVDTAAKAFSEQLVALALEMRRANPRGAPVSVLQVARYAAPESSSASIMLAAMLNSADRTEDALAVLRTVQRGDPFYADALDAQVRALGDAERLDEALSLAQAGVQRSDARSEDFGRLGDVLSAMERHDAAAAAYQRAVALGSGLKAEQLWPLLLLQASALEAGDKWPQAKAVLQQALRVGPEQAPILNFLGYAQLERGEDLEAAEAMIRKAVALAPDDASITDSLGWALFKRGRTDEAIQLLEQAAKGDPTQAEIHEHLGDAYFTAGRRFEARFAWSAALATAEDEDAGRLRSKVASGLTPATAAR
jgi:tetratricopeptide (TPR) repeat protein